MVRGFTVFELFLPTATLCFMVQAFQGKDLELCSSGIRLAHATLRYTWAGVASEPASPPAFFRGGSGQGFCPGCAQPSSQPETGS